jgi:hypothetical protein
MVPSKVAKMNSALPVFPFADTLNCPVPLATMPVGVPKAAPLLGAGGMVTIGCARFWPAPL